MTQSQAMSSSFVAIADYAIARKETPINGKLYHAKVDEHWEFWVNATDEPQEVEGTPIQPFECYVKFNGWPAGIFTPYNGCFAAGEAANEETFCAALRKASA